MTFEEKELHPSLAEKAAALGFSLIQNHPFVDGNKRIGHASMELFQVLNGYEIEAAGEEQEDVELQVASGEMEREQFALWMEKVLGEAHRARGQAVD